MTKVEELETTKEPKKEIPIGVSKISLRNGKNICKIFKTKKDMEKFISWTKNGTEIKKIKQENGFLKINPEEIQSVEYKEINKKRVKYFLPIAFVMSQKSLFDGKPIKPILNATFLLMFFSVLSLFIGKGIPKDIMGAINANSVNEFLLVGLAMLNMVSFAALSVILFFGMFKAITNPKVSTEKKEEYYAYVFNLKESETTIANDLIQVLFLISLNYLILKPLFANLF